MSDGDSSTSECQLKTGERGTTDDWGPDIAAKIRDLEETVKTHLPLLGLHAPNEEPRRGARLDVPQVNIYNNPTATSTSIASANTEVRIELWARAISAVDTLKPSEREEARALIQELREVLEGRRPLAAAKDYISRLVGFGGRFFIDVLPALLAYRDALGPILGI